MEPPYRTKNNYKWVIVALCFIMVFTCLGFCSSNKSLYLAAITDALHIKRSAFSINDSFRFVATAVVNIFFGALVNKFGTKKLIIAGFVSLICSSLIYAYATNIFVFYLGGIFLGIGLSWTTTTMVGCVINKWCTENRGTIMGAVLAANGLGGALAAQIVSPIIYQEGNAFGYQNAYKLVALILFVVAILILIFYRENPPEYDGAAYVHKKKAHGQSWVGIEYNTAIKQPYFYLAAICIFFTGLALQGINGVAAAHMKDVGLDAAYVATVLSVHSLALAGFKFLIGFLYDRFGLRFTMTVCDMAALSVMLILALLTNSALGRTLAMIYGILSSVALPLETIMLPIFANDIFGDKSYNKVLGLFVSINTAGYAIGAPLANWVFDTYGSYKPMFYVCCFVMILITIVFQYVITVSHHHRQEIIQKESV